MDQAPDGLGSIQVVEPSPGINPRDQVLRQADRNDGIAAGRRPASLFLYY
jgi:hypothetical protein